MTDSDDHLADLPLLEPSVTDLLADPRLWGDPAPGLADHVAAVVQSESGTILAPPTSAIPRWTRPALLGAAAVVALLFVGIVVLSAIGGGPGGARVAEALTPTGLVPDVEGGEAEFSESDSGVAIALDAPTLPRLDGQRHYEAWVITVGGDVVSVGTFRAGHDVLLWAGVDLSDIQAFSITREQAEPGDSPDQRGSGEVVLKATVAVP
jgi:Anti-sigma-K factor rskA, C-terminal